MKKIFIIIALAAALSHAARFDAKRIAGGFFYDSTQTIRVFTEGISCTARCVLDISDSAAMEHVLVVAEMGDTVEIPYTFPRAKLKGAAQTVTLTFRGGVPNAPVTATARMFFRDPSPVRSIRPATRPGRARAGFLSFYRMDGRVKP